ncbi:unnamed protein product [Schistosoma curassoni]|uniref:Uncharacterized protein n=1 Tax=Schistosoma curassoni TaxID=6186 RepID=A0A183JDZ8_9TREM|nr:unnamed protein product [Schistosoma curassoni]
MIIIIMIMWSRELAFSKSPMLKRNSLPMFPSF